MSDKTNKDAVGGHIINVNGIRIPDTHMGPDCEYFNKLRKNTIPMGIATAAPAMPEPLPEGSWQCFHCRQINFGKFCTECGRKRPQMEGSE